MKWTENASISVGHKHMNFPIRLLNPRKKLSRAKSSMLRTLSLFLSKMSWSKIHVIVPFLECKIHDDTFINFRLLCRWLSRPTACLSVQTLCANKFNVPAFRAYFGSLFNPWIKFPLKKKSIWQILTGLFMAENRARKRPQRKLHIPNSHH